MWVLFTRVSDFQFKEFWSETADQLIHFNGFLRVVQISKGVNSEQNCKQNLNLSFKTDNIYVYY